MAFQVLVKCCTLRYITALNGISVLALGCKQIYNVLAMAEGKAMVVNISTCSSMLHKTC